MKPVAWLNPSMQRGQRGWRVEWRERGRLRWDPAVRLSCWFADYDKAVIVRDHLRAGTTFEGDRVEQLSRLNQWLVARGLSPEPE